MQNRMNDSIMIDPLLQFGFCCRHLSVCSWGRKLNFAIYENNGDFSNLLAGLLACLLELKCLLLASKKLDSLAVF